MVSADALEVVFVSFSAVIVASELATSAVPAVGTLPSLASFTCAPVIVSFFSRLPATLCFFSFAPLIFVECLAAIAKVPPPTARISAR